MKSYKKTLSQSNLLGFNERFLTEPSSYFKTVLSKSYHIESV